MASDHRVGLTEQRLLRGWATSAAGVKIRLAVADDLTAIERLMPAADVQLGEAIASAVQDGSIGGAHRAALRARGAAHGVEAFTRALGEKFAEGNPDKAYLAASLVLVAAHPDDGVMGVLVAYPPSGLVNQYLKQVTSLLNGNEHFKLIMQGAMGLVKIQALVVSEQTRRAGIGGALLSRANTATALGDQGGGRWSRRR